jgi:hypothetical protein
VDTTALDDYDPLDGPEQTMPDTRKAKTDAFFAAATVGTPENLEPLYDQVLGDLQRFGKSPVIEQVKENWKHAASKEVEFKASEIVLNTSLPPEEKQFQIARLIQEAEKDPEPKDLWEASIGATDKYKPDAVRQTPMQILVRGDLGHSVQAQPRSYVLGKFADTFLALKNKMDRYEVKDWVPLIGGEGLGELWAGDAADFFEAASYYGLSAAMEYAPVVAGGRSNPLNYRIKKEAVDAAFVGLDLMGIAALGKDGAKAAVRKGLESFKASAPTPPRMEPTMGPMDDLMVGPNSPITVIEYANKDMAAEVLANSVGNPKMADAIGTSPSGIIVNHLLPKAKELPSLDGELVKVYPDIAARLEASDRSTLHYFDLGKVDPYLFDVTAIKSDVDMHYRLMQEQAELTPMMASSYMEDTGRALRGSILYGKSDNVGFTDPLEVFDARGELVERVAKNYSEELTGKAYSSLTPKERGKLYRAVEGKVTPVQGDNGEWFVKWDIDRKYDPVVNTFFGYGATSAKFANWEVGAFANNSIGKWIYDPASRLPEWITAGFTRATVRATNLEKVWGDIMRQEVLSTRPRRQLAQAIYKTEELGKNLTVTDLREMYPVMGAKDFKSLVGGYYNYRRLVDYQYMVVNDVYRTQKITSGFKGGYDSQGRYLNNLVREVVKDPDSLDADGVIVPGRKSLIGSDDAPATEVYDFSMVDAIERGQTVKKHKGGVNISEVDVDTTHIYRLDKPVKKDGKVYEFAMGVKEGKAPENLLPQIPGYYPHINDEHYFIKAIPEKLFLNGKEVPKDAEHMHLYEAHASTVGVERTQALGDKFARKLSAENSDFTYKVAFERAEIDDTMRTAMDTVKYAQDVAKSRRQERLTLSDGGLGRLEDPAVSLDKRLNQAARLHAWKDIDFEFRQKFLEKYKNYTEGKFPETVADIKLPKNTTDVHDERAVKDAVSIFEQYAKQQRTANSTTDQLWQGSTLQVGRWMEEVSPKISETMFDWSKTRDPVLSIPLKIATYKFIHLNPIKQYITQPSQIFELNALALSQGNVQFSRDMANLFSSLLVNSLTRDSKKIPDALKKMASDYANIPTGMSKKEYHEVLDAFWDSGIPKSIDLHAVLDGVFRSASDELDISTLKQGAQQTYGMVKGLADMPKQVGYNVAELMNQIGIWLYARSEFMRLNPGKKWNDPHNLEAIAAKQWGVGNTMYARGSVLPYQEGVMRAFFQFTAVTNKGVMQPFNSKFLTKEEKSRLVAIRLAAFGEKGVLGVPIAMDMIKRYHYGETDSNPEAVGENTPVDQFFKIAARGLSDMAMNKMLQMMWDEDGKGETELQIGKTMALSPETGIPMGDVVRDMVRWAKGDGKASDVAPFLPAVSAITDTANVLWDVFQTRDIEDADVGKTMRYVSETSEFASGYSNFQKGLAMLHYGKLVDKHNNPTDLNATVAEAIGKMAGLESYRSDTLYKVMRQDAELKKEIKSGAEMAIASLHTIEDIYDQSPSIDGTQSDQDAAQRIYKLMQRVKHLSAIYAQDPILEEEYGTEMWRLLNKETKDRGLSLIHRIMSRKTSDFDVSRKMMMEQLLQIKGSDPALAKQLEVMVNEFKPELGSK